MSLKKLDRMDESYIVSQVEREAERYYKKYRPYMQLMESVCHWKRYKPISAWDYKALGNMLESTDDLVKM
jgi:hypothetical protein